MGPDWSMEWYDYVRLANAGVALLAAYHLARQFSRNGENFTTKIRDYWWALMALMFTIFAGQIEQIIRNREETWVLFIVFFAALACLKAARNPQVVTSKEPTSSPD